MFQFYFIARNKFNIVLNELNNYLDEISELYNTECKYIVEDYKNIDDILYLDPNINYYYDN